MSSQVKKIIFFFLVLIIVLAGILVYQKGRVKKTPVVTDFTDDDLIDTSNQQQQQLPELLPDNFPIYPESQVINNWTSRGETVGVSVVWETKDPVETVFAYMIDNLSLLYELEVSGETDSYTASFWGSGVFGFLGVATAESGGSIISATISYNNE